MNNAKFWGLAFIATLLVSLGGSVDAQDGRRTGNAQTDRPTGVLSGFPCGPDLTCDATQYCSVLIGGPKGVPPGYRCVEATAGSAGSAGPAGPAPTCKTIPDPGLGCKCTELNGGITVTCTAP